LPGNSTVATHAQSSTGPAPRILVIDDDHSVLRAIRLSLILEDFDVATASGAEEGLRLIDASDFDLVLLDLQMPGMDGRACFRELRARGHQTPVLILSAYGAERARDELQAEGAVSKPFDPDELVARVRELLPPGPATPRSGE
jgi:DNA-binding response OmpR family regulator